MIEDFVGRMLAIRDAAHKAHWAANSYAAHKAFQSLYEALPDLLDKYVEVYQGAAELLDSVPTFEAREKLTASKLQKEAQWLAENKDSLACGIGALANILDELEACLLQTVYKLRHLS